MLLMVPYQTDVPMERWPFSNVTIIAVTVICFGAFVLSGELTVDHPLVLNGWRLSGMLGCLLLHGGLLHLVGNMIFLWTFGNAVCAKVGNVAFLLIYLVLGFAASATHLALSAEPAIGASGAINGIVGMYLVMYPLNNVSMFYTFFLRYNGTFDISSFWMILLWFVFDVWGASSGAGRVAYWAHLGGFAAGFVIALALLLVGLVQMDDRSERSLLDVFGVSR